LAALLSALLPALASRLLLLLSGLLLTAAALLLLAGLLLSALLLSALLLLTTLARILVSHEVFLLREDSRRSETRLAKLSSFGGSVNFHYRPLALRSAKKLCAMKK
jgi:hypothetical protein